MVDLKKMDRVFHIKYGWGTVDDKIGEDVFVFFDKQIYGQYNVINDGLLSYTEYTLDGFTQEKPKPSWNNIWDDFLESEYNSVVHYLDENFEPPVRKCK